MNNTYLSSAFFLGNVKKPEEISINLFVSIIANKVIGFAVHYVAKLQVPG